MGWGSEDEIRRLPATTKRLLDLAIQKGHEDQASLIKAINPAYKAKSKDHKNISGGNFSKYWTGSRKWDKGNLILEVLAGYFGVSMNSLLSVWDPIPIVAELAAGEEIPYRQEWPLQDFKLGEADNFQWEDEELKRIYAMRVKDRSLLPVLNQGTIVYARRGYTVADLREFDLVIYNHRPLAAQLWGVHNVSDEDEIITLTSLNPALPPKPLLRNHAGSFDLVIMTVRRQY